jgi:hypothetical protein
MVLQEAGALMVTEKQYSSRFSDKDFFSFMPILSAPSQDLIPPSEPGG